MMVYSLRVGNFKSLCAKKLIRFEDPTLHAIDHKFNLEISELFQQHNGVRTDITCKNYKLTVMNR